MTTQAPLYIVRDNALNKVVGDPAPYAMAGQLATACSISAGNRGERVAMPSGLDRFTVARAPVTHAPAPTFTTLQVEAALCLYEAMLDARLEGTSPAISEAFAAAGSATMRHHAMTLAPFALQVFDLIPESVRFGHAYDFAVIPAILATVKWSHAGYLTPPVTDAARDVVAVLESV